MKDSPPNSNIPHWLLLTMRSLIGFILLGQVLLIGHEALHSQHPELGDCITATNSSHSSTHHCSICHFAFATSEPPAILFASSIINRPYLGLLFIGAWVAISPLKLATHGSRAPPYYPIPS